jgi:hypothetical protein
MLFTVVRSAFLLWTGCCNREPGTQRMSSRIGAQGMPTASGCSGKRRAGAFAGWYINMQSPFLRTDMGFDATDNILDIWVGLDGSISWKDDDELDEAVRTGAVKAEAAREIRREAARAAETVRGREPFTDAWTRWRPDAAWPVPALKPGWESVPPAELDFDS